MTASGQVRDGFARITLALPTGDGSSISVEFIVDTGFEGELAIPGELISRLDIEATSVRPISLADGTFRLRPYHELILSLDDDKRRTEVLQLDGNPLLGIGLLEESLLHVEASQGARRQRRGHRTSPLRRLIPPETEALRHWPHEN